MIKLIIGVSGVQLRYRITERDNKLEIIIARWKVRKLLDTKFRNALMSLARNYSLDHNVNNPFGPNDLEE